MKATIKGDNATTYILLPATANAGTTPIPSPIDPMHNYDGFSLVLVTTGTLAGSWKVTAADDYTAQAGLQNSPASAGNFADVSALCQPALAAVLSGGSKQYVQISPFMGGAIQVTFTPTSGAGSASAYRVAKGNR
jgi:hypothetical protein